jgi:hypothetical protein
MNRLCEICHGEIHETFDHPYLPQMETHSPMKEDQLIKVEDGKGATVLDEWNTQEINMNVKDLDEGGMGSGRQPDYGEPINQGVQPGELIAFETVSIGGGLSGVDIGGKKHIEETISKQIADTRLGNCPCKNRAKQSN